MQDVYNQGWSAGRHSLLAAAAILCLKMLAQEEERARRMLSLSRASDLTTPTLLEQECHRLSEVLLKGESAVHHSTTIRDHLAWACQLMRVHPDEWDQAVMLRWEPRQTLP